MSVYEQLWPDMLFTKEETKSIVNDVIDLQIEMYIKVDISTAIIRPLSLRLGSSSSYHVFENLMTLGMPKCRVFDFQQI